MEHSDNLAYCRDAVAAPGSNLYYACLFVAPAPRERVIALHAFEAEIQRSLAASDDPGVVRLRLQWWREELARAAAGQARHPVGQALQALLQDRWLAPADLDDYLLAREAELGPPAGPAGFPELLETFCRGPGWLWRLSGRLCGIEDAAGLAAAARLGGLHHLFLALQHLADDLRRGYCRTIPPAELRAAGLEADAAAAEDEAHWRELLERQFQRLHDELLAAVEGVPATVAAPAPHCPILARMDIVLCREILRDDCAVLRKRYALTPLRKLWIAWRTSRKIKGPGIKG